jgi:hypothetical protein
VSYTSFDEQLDVENMFTAATTYWLGLSKVRSTSIWLAALLLPTRTSWACLTLQVQPGARLCRSISSGTGMMGGTQALAFPRATRPTPTCHTRTGGPTSQQRARQTPHTGR